MIANLLRVSESELEAYLNDSSLLENRIYNDESEEDDPRLIDVDKAWDGIIYLLTGQNATNTNHPLVSVFFSGQLIDKIQDLGYGPAHYLTPKQVKEINKALSELPVENLAKKFNSKKMVQAGVYPDIWEEEGDEALSYLLSRYSDIKEFYMHAAKENQAIISFLN